MSETAQTPKTRTVEIPVGSMIKVDVGDEPGELSVVVGNKSSRAYQLIGKRWRRCGDVTPAGSAIWSITGTTWSHLVVDEQGVTVVHSVARVIDVECWETGKEPSRG